MPLKKMGNKVKPKPRGGVPGRVRKLQTAGALNRSGGKSVRKPGRA